MSRAGFGLFLALVVLFGSSIEAAGFGTWKNYTAMNTPSAVTFAHDTMWVASGGGAYRFTPSDSTYLSLNNSNGLSSNNLTAVDVDSLGTVWFGSVNGSIDVYQPQANQWRSIRDIASTDRAAKSIHSFCSFGDTVLIASDFGISIFDRTRWEFRDTYLRVGGLPSQIPILRMMMMHDTVWAITAQGVSFIRRSDRFDVPSAWTTILPTAIGYSATIRSAAPSPAGVTIFTSIGPFVLSNGLWQPLADPLRGIDCSAANGNTQVLVFSTTDGAILRFSAGGRIDTLVTLSSAASAIAIGPSNAAAIGETGTGVLLQTQSRSFSLRLPNGPPTNLFSSLAVDGNGKLWVGTGINNLGAGFFSYDGSRWESYNAQNTPTLQSNDYYDVSIGNGNTVWVSSWGFGAVAVFPTGAIRVFNAENTGFVGIPQNTKFVVIGGIASDPQGNTWMTVRSAANGNVIAVQKGDSTWTFFKNGLSSSVTLLTKLVIDAYGTKWMVSEDPQMFGVIYFNDRGTLNDITDDIWGYVSMSNGLVSNTVKSIAVDLSGDVWIGTDLGLNHVTNPSNPTANGSISPYVSLRGVSVTAIAVDALNHKWVATPDGVIELSSDGLTVLNQYTNDNTNGALVSTQVSDIAADRSHGIVYFGTDQGLSSFTTIAINPVTSAKDLICSPNPFYPSRQQTIRIDGLAADSRIKVITVDGSEVADFDTPGGRIAEWPGLDKNGKPLSSGIYYIIAYTKNGDQIARGKLAVIR